MSEQIGTDFDTMPSEASAEMYNKGYRYLLNMVRDGEVHPPLYIKQMIDIGPLMRDYKDCTFTFRAVNPDGSLGET